MLLERTLALDLDGEVSTEFRPEGLLCTIEAPMPRPQQRHMSALAGRRILVVEDEALLAVMVAEISSRAGERPS